MLVLTGFNKCTAYRKDGKPCLGRCPKGKTVCAREHMDGKTVVVIKKGAKGPNVRDGKCMGFNKNGDPCQTKCPAGFRICWRHDKDGNVVETITKGATGKSTTVYAYSDDEEEEDEDAEYVYEDEEDEEPAQLQTKTPLKKDQCLCFEDNGTRCRRKVAYGELFYCYKHVETRSCDVSVPEMESRKNSNPNFRDGGEKERCCAGGVEDGKCKYSVCDDNYDMDYKKAQNSLLAAKRAGNKNAQKKIEAQLAAENCENCGKVFKVEVTEGPKDVFKTCTKKRGEAETCTTTPTRR